MKIEDFIDLLRNADKRKQRPIEVKSVSCEASPILPKFVDKREDAPIPETPPAPKPDFGNWMKSDAHGTVIGGGVEQDGQGEPPFRNVSRIYGTKRR